MISGDHIGIAHMVNVTWVFLFHDKSQVHMLLKFFISFVKTQFNCQIKTVRSDNGSEFMNKYLTQFLASLGIIHKSSCVKTLK